MNASSLPDKERKILQYGTIAAILVLIYLFFVEQRIILSMILGALMLIAQRTYLWRRGKQPRT